ncbi:Modification methylase FokI [subsurface metagenome]
MKIDAIRQKIQEWLDSEMITEEEFYILLVSLIDEADYVANMSGTYGAFLKIWRSVALNHLTLKAPELIPSNKEHETHLEDANKLVRKVEADILYIDPPYNTRQYAPNFHLPETIARWDNPAIYGKTGLRPYDNQKSEYNCRAKALLAFRNLIEQSRARYICVSYNDEGIIPQQDMHRVLSNKGETVFYQQPYRRFRTESDHERRHYKRKDDRVVEYLYVVKVHA